MDYLLEIVNEIALSKEATAYQVVVFVCLFLVLTQREILRLWGTPTAQRWMRRSTGAAVSLLMAGVLIVLARTAALVLP